MLLAAAIFALGACAAPTPAADERACAVYRAFYAQTKNETQSALAPVTKPYSLEWGGAPSRFHNNTGEDFVLRILPAGSEAETVEVIEVDTGSYFDALHQGPRQSVRGCFDAAQQPEFSGSALEFALSTAVRAWARGEEVIAPGVWRLSPAGYSADGRFALIYAEYECWDWCGMGAFYLFEQRDGRWEYVGDSGVWFA
ncbi:MAG: hypothetical protein NVV62_03680 [Terricaulis sp.]|nr:hypothetical protein [Terricaulis sp.]